MSDAEGSSNTSSVIESAVAFGWRIMDRCRAHSSVAERTTASLFGDVGHWHPADISHGDLGVAMVYSAADQVDADGGWDRLAHAHLAEAALHFMHGSPPPGLFVGVSALAFAFRANSRFGQRYRRATADIDVLLSAQLDSATKHLSPEEGSATADYDIISGLAGAITYAFTTDAGADRVGESALRTIDVLAELALTDRPGGLWTPEAKLDVFERGQYGHARAVLNCGFGHGVVGVLNVLGQACDRGWGSPLVLEAAESLTDILLAASDVGGIFDVPDVIPRKETRSLSRSRYAWCYGNLGAALPFHNSATLRRHYPGIVARLLDTSARADEDLRLGGPSLCHGRAGKLVLERIMLGEQATADNALSLMQLANPQRTFLLEDDVGIDSPGFLEGAGGAGAALLSLQTACDAMPFTRMFSGTWIHD